MNPDTIAFDKMVKESFGPADLAEEFYWYAEDHVTWEPRQAYFDSIRDMPIIMRRLYLVLHMNTAVSGDGFPGFWDEFEDRSLIPEIVAGLEMIKKKDLADILQEAVSYLACSAASAHESNTPVVQMDSDTQDIHGRYFQLHKDLDIRIGKFVKKNGRRVIEQRKDG